MNPKTVNALAAMSILDDFTNISDGFGESLRQNIFLYGIAPACNEQDLTVQPKVASK
jgi:hypothetical protein